MRIGHGFDVHRFIDGNHVMLGGIRVPHDQGVEAHSDGDVLLHALCDALLGALALGDIGHLFPDTDQAYAGADSRNLLAEVYGRVQKEGYCLCNTDLTVVAQSPKLAPYTDQIRLTLAADLKVELSQVSVKATTTEKLGYVGRKEGISAHAVVLLEKSMK